MEILHATGVPPRILSFLLIYHSQLTKFYAAAKLAADSPAFWLIPAAGAEGAAP